MSTRAQVRFATRETGQSFNEHPEKIHAQFYVHSDGYPEGLGLDIAYSLDNHGKVNGYWEIEELQTQHGDLEYIYYIWQAYDKETWISIFEVVKDYTITGFYDECGDDIYDYSDNDKCIFVGAPEKLISKYKLNTNDDG